MIVQKLLFKLVEMIAILQSSKVDSKVFTLMDINENLRDFQNSMPKL